MEPMVTFYTILCFFQGLGGFFSRCLEMFVCVWEEAVITLKAKFFHGTV